MCQMKLAVFLDDSHRDTILEQSKSCCKASRSRPNLQSIFSVSSSAADTRIKQTDHEDLSRRRGGLRVHVMMSDFAKFVMRCVANALSVNVKKHLLYTSPQKCPIADPVFERRIIDNRVRSRFGSGCGYIPNSYRQIAKVLQSHHDADEEA
jgi:hypothetical protein